MSGAGAILLDALASKGQRAHDLASAICGLVVNGGKLGELDDDAAVGADGDWRSIKILPQIWLDRLVTAVEVGAFDRLSVDEIVLRILTPLADHPE